LKSNTPGEWLDGNVSLIGLIRAVNPLLSSNDDLRFSTSFMKLKTLAAPVGALLLCATLGAQSPPNSAQPDPRFKADLLVVVAHPDDESEIGAFLAKARFDEHKRVAVIYGTRGNGGGNAVGQEQAAALGAIREIEGRQALNFLGISDVWFLDGPDTPGQDVLRSLETWDHGRALDKLVRLVRLTRPDVIATWLPAYTAGENHGDHQAAGILATEAFDMAGDPTQFPEQVTPPREATDILNLTEGLHPWQAQKLYYFSDASHYEFLAGKGPEYSAAAISPSKHESYEQLSAEECAFHLTQSDSGYLAKVSLENHTLDKTYFHEPSRFVFGKAHVDASTTGDVFSALKPGAIPYVAPPGYRPLTIAGPTLELGGPWHYYHLFLAAHGLEHLSTLVPPEVEAGVSTKVSLPVLVHNPGPDALSVALKVQAPPGWVIPPSGGKYQVPAGETLAKRVVLAAPSREAPEWENIKIDATDGKTVIGAVNVRAHVVRYSLPQ
jgi:LmbE family N-acetylglucosaminyl deacetylase